MTTNYHYREPNRYPQSPRVAAPSSNYYTADNRMAHVKVVSSQPGRSVWDFEHRWSNKLCSCCTDCKQCCFAFFCPCCFECKLYERAGENMCTGLCPGARFALRSKIRTAFRIEGDLCNDCCISTFCPCCTAIQLTRELHYQGL